MTAHLHHSEPVASDDLQAAIAVNHLISNQGMRPEQAIEQLSDIALQIQLGIQNLWDKITPAETITPWLHLTQIEELSETLGSVIGALTAGVVTWMLGRALWRKHKAAR